jgi:tetratricopeptide (TPR) repeat protein
MKTIGRELDVQYVLEGSVRKVGNNLRITAQLIEATSDAHIWAEKYSGTLDDVFDIQEQVSRSIVDALEMRLSPAEVKKMTKRLIDNPKAYELYLKAREELNSLSTGYMQRSQDFLEKALKIAGDNSMLYAALGHVNFQYYNLGIHRDKKYLELALSWAEKSLELDPNSPKPYSILGPIKYKEGRLQEAVRQLKKALQIDPNDEEALQWIVYMYGDAGKTEIAYPLSARLRRIEPLYPGSYWGYGWLRTMDGKFDLARDVFRQMYKMESQSQFSGLFYAITLAYLNEMPKAFSIFKIITQDDPKDFFALMASFYTFALKKDEQKMRDSIGEKILEYCESDEVYSLWLAEGFSLIDDKKEAMRWLENSVDKGLICYPFLNEYDPFLESIRGEPRFKKLMERVKNEWENFEA